MLVNINYSDSKLDNYTSNSKYFLADQFIFDSLYPYGEKSKFDLYPTVQMDSSSGKEEGTFLLLPVCNDVDRPLRVGCWTKFTFELAMNR